MTEKLYEKNALLKECEATVISCEPSDGKFLVVLDRTVIFPEGGGQLSDTGKINEAVVSYAQEKGGEVLHHTSQEFKPGDKVKVTLDWKVRLDRMQQHTGEHLLSYAFFSTSGANNIGFHMNEEQVTVDLDKEVTQEEVDKAEIAANEAIWENRPITIEYLPDEEVAKLPMRKKNEKLKGILRIVTVEGGDICTCCGTHPPFTGMVGVVKVLKFEKHKGGTRVFFNCGARALKDMQGRNLTLENTSNMLSVKVEEVPQAVEKLKSEITELQTKNKEKTMELFKYQLPKLLAEAPVDAEGNRFIYVVQELEPRDAKNLMQLLSGEEKVVVGIVAYYKGRVSYQFALGKDVQGDCNIYCQKANKAFGGKGGGKGNFAQGGAQAPENWEEIAVKLKETIQ